MEMKLIKNTSEAALIEVTFEDAIDRMSQRGFNGQEKFIKMTKGKNHQITVYDKDSNVLLSFGFGRDGYTPISTDTQVLRDKVTNFLLRNRIQMRKQSTIFETDLKIMPPKAGLGIAGHFCVHLGGDFATFLPSEELIQSVFGKYEIYNTETAVTGVTVHHAKLI